MNHPHASRPCIVITSIFEPSEAITSFAGMTGHTTIVAGDNKTPANWNHPNTEYLSVEKQQSIGRHLNKVLPYNHYCRKMIGYLYAMQNNASCIIDTDDDNHPKQNWQFPEAEGMFDCIQGDKGFINIYQLYTDQKIWPRGLPLKKIKQKQNLEAFIGKTNCKVGIWQGLVDGDPDVDAIYRLTDDTPCYFNERAPVVLAPGTISPFNSQNTLYCKELFELLYLPAHVTFRFTDILRGLIAQPIMWQEGYQLGFTEATVVQKRNEHDYFKDFLSEIPVFRYADDVIDITTGAVVAGQSISDNLMNVYHALCKKDIVPAQELEILEAWLLDVQEINAVNSKTVYMTEDRAIV